MKHVSTFSHPTKVSPIPVKTPGIAIYDCPSQNSAKTNMKMLEHERYHRAVKRNRYIFAPTQDTSTAYSYTHSLCVLHLQPPFIVLECVLLKVFENVSWCVYDVIHVPTKYYPTPVSSIYAKTEVCNLHLSIFEYSSGTIMKRLAANWITSLTFMKSSGGTKVCFGSRVIKILMLFWSEPGVTPNTG